MNYVQIKSSTLHVDEETKDFFSRLLIQSPALLEIYFYSIGNDGLLQIAASHCAPNLRSIRARVDDNSLQAIMSVCRACPNLINLDLVFEPGDLCGDEVILTAVQSCPLIEVLPTNNLQLTNIAINAMFTIHSLRELKLTSKECTSAAIQGVLSANPNLTVLSIDTAAIDSALVSCIGNCCRNLTDLMLNPHKNPSTSYNALCELFRGCPLLMRFKLYQDSVIRNASLSALFQYCHHLTELDLFIDNESLNLDPAINPLHDETQSVLTISYPTLTKLRVRGTGVGDRALRDIFTHCTELRSIELQNCRYITDETITALAQNCCNLSTMYLSDCHSVTAVGMLNVATYCTRLKILGLSSMPITDEILIRLSLHCININSLYLSHSVGGLVTAAGVVAVAEGCTGLTFLIIRGMMESLTAPLDIDKLKQLYPHIMIGLTS